MGNSSSSSGSSSISVADVLALVSQEEADARAAAPVHDGPAPSESELPSKLSALGVEMGEASIPDAIRCWRYVAEQDFWRNHYNSHPNKKRVKAWLFVHGKFRASAASLVDAAESMHTAITQGCEASKTDSASRRVDSSLKSLVGKVEKHSDFEDTQLFRFFKEHVPEVGDHIRDLEADHSEKQLENDALDSVRTIRCAPQTAGGTSSGDDLASAAAAVEALKAYVASLEAHLEKEERAIVGRWLNLDAEMYAKYRTYLVGKYKLVY
eukprot:g10254.t1